MGWTLAGDEEPVYLMYDDLPRHMTAKYRRMVIEVGEALELNTVAMDTKDHFLASQGVQFYAQQKELTYAPHLNMCDSKMPSVSALKHKGDDVATKKKKLSTQASVFFLASAPETENLETCEDEVDGEDDEFKASTLSRASFRRHRARGSGRACLATPAKSPTYVGSPSKFSSPLRLTTSNLSAHDAQRDRTPTRAASPSFADAISTVASEVDGCPKDIAGKARYWMELSSVSGVLAEKMQGKAEKEGKALMKKIAPMPQYSSEFATLQNHFKFVDEAHLIKESSTAAVTPKQKLEILTKLKTNKIRIPWSFQRYQIKTEAKAMLADTKICTPAMALEFTNKILPYKHAKVVEDGADEAEEDSSNYDPTKPSLESCTATPQERAHFFFEFYIKEVMAAQIATPDAQDFVAMHSKVSMEATTADRDNGAIPEQFNDVVYDYLKSARHLLDLLEADSEYKDIEENIERANDFESFAIGQENIIAAVIQNAIEASPAYAGLLADLISSESATKQHAHRMEKLMETIEEGIPEETSKLQSVVVEMTTFAADLRAWQHDSFATPREKMANPMVEKAAHFCADLETKVQPVFESQAPGATELLKATKDVLTGCAEAMPVNEVLHRKLRRVDKQIKDAWLQARCLELKISADAIVTQASSSSLVEDIVYKNEDLDDLSKACDKMKGVGPKELANSVCLPAFSTLWNCGAHAIIKGKALTKEFFRACHSLRDFIPQGHIDHAKSAVGALKAFHELAISQKEIYDLGEANADIVEQDQEGAKVTVLVRKIDAATKHLAKLTDGCSRDLAFRCVSATQNELI